MITGIYALQFNFDLTYIGQSIDIDARTSRHLRELRNNHHYNSKLQEAYNTFGDPQIYIIEISNSSNLNMLENVWIKEFDSCINGLNIRDEQESVLRGPKANGAKFSESQIIQVFELLCDINNLGKDIERITGVPRGSINCLARGSSHKWLAEKYPEKYALMLSLKGKRNGLQNTLGNRHNMVFPTIMSPEGLIYSNINNMAKFGREHNLCPDQLINLVRGHANSVKGWTVKK